ncbi:MAG: hypothetical protein EKK37_02510 [Sphingobacteriales bacterium]|nr:MAG: hypothetical protein EKK37_02510 [Sphingobacteriales bacterium]
MTEHELVKECMAAICKKNGFTRPSEMTYRDFEHISQELEEKTGTLISVSTIKRLLNGDFSRIPQTATLNAISNYLDFKNWQEYKIASHIPETKPVSVPVAQAKNSFIPSITPGKLIYNKWTSSLLAVAVLLMIFSFIKGKTSSVVSYKSASFSFKKTTANDLPNTVVFEYDVTGVEADSFFIQQSWDSTRRVRVDKSKHTLTDIYYEPGYHVAKLIANDSIIKTIDVSIPTDKWIYYAKERNFTSHPQYIKVSGFNNGYLTITKEDAEKSLINLEKENLYVMTYFPSSFNVSSDNYLFKSRVRVVNNRNISCASLMCEVFTQRNFNYFMTFPSGCASVINGQYGEVKLNGQTNNLSAMAINPNEWNDIEVVVINKTVHIKFNGKEVFSCGYHQSSGLITGLGFISNGFLQVDYTELSGGNGKIVYKNDFEK